MVLFEENIFCPSRKILHLLHSIKRYSFHYPNAVHHLYTLSFLGGTQRTKLHFDDQCWSIIPFYLFLLLGFISGSKWMKKKLQNIHQATFSTTTRCGSLSSWKAYGWLNMWLHLVSRVSVFWQISQFFFLFILGLISTSQSFDMIRTS